MKLFNLDHVALLPYTTCNFKCSYCVDANRRLSMKVWDARASDILTFLNELSAKAVMVSGGEPLLWKDWPRLIKETLHTWYFLTNASVLPSWLRSTRHSIKLVIAAYHRSQMDINTFIRNIETLQDMSYPVFVKIVYDGTTLQFYDIEQIQKANIPVSFSPMLGVKLTKEQIDKALPYCQSEMYKSRFLPPPFGKRRNYQKCNAGTSSSFEIDGSKLLMCSHKTSLFDRIGTLDKPKLHRRAYPCYKNHCACEWHTFSELDTRPNENVRWQKFVDTGAWK